MTFFIDADAEGFAAADIRNAVVLQILRKFQKALRRREVRKRAVRVAQVDLPDQGTDQHEDQNQQKRNQAEHRALLFAEVAQNYAQRGFQLLFGQVVDFLMRAKEQALEPANQEEFLFLHFAPLLYLSTRTRGSTRP